MRASTQEEREFNAYITEKMPKTNLIGSCAKAFLTGGLICVLGQFLFWVGIALIGLEEIDVWLFVSVTLIFLTALLTGIGVFDKIAKFGGAGAFVPITGFANAMVSPAMEFKREGFILGVGAKLFTIAGPVIVYGVCSSILMGLLVLIFGG